MILIWQFWILTYRNKHILQNSVKSIIASTLLLIIAPNHTKASEALYFKEAKNHKEKNIISFIKKTYQAFDKEYILAPADLNNDGINEYVVKEKNCPSNTICRHHIIAIMEDKPISLLSVNAKKIIVNDTNNYGVRNITIYDNKMNDFKKSKYLWNPHSYLYEQKH